MLESTTIKNKDIVKKKCYIHKFFFLYIKSANALIVICYSAFGLFNPHCSSAFLFFFFVVGFVFAFLSFLLFILNIYYLNVHIKLHWLNKFLPYFHNYLTIYIVHWPLFFFLLVLFLSILLNIYMYIHSYTDTTYSYNIFTIIEVSIF